MSIPAVSSATPNQQHIDSAKPKYESLKLNVIDIQQKNLLWKGVGYDTSPECKWADTKLRFDNLEAIGAPYEAYICKIKDKSYSILIQTHKDDEREDNNNDSKFHTELFRGGRYEIDLRDYAQPGAKFEIFYQEYSEQIEARVAERGGTIEFA